MGHRIWNDLDKEMKYGSGVGEKELISILSLRQISCADFGEKKCLSQNSQEIRFTLFAVDEIAHL